MKLVHELLCINKKTTIYYNAVIGTSKHKKLSK